MIIRARGFFLLMILFLFQHAIFGAEELKDGLYAKLETSRGEILLQLYHQRVPQTVANFVGLAEATKAWRDPISGKSKKTRFYDDHKTAIEDYTESLKFNSNNTY